MDSGISGAVAAAGVGIFMALMAKFVPYRPNPGQVSRLSLEELAKQYRKWELAALFPFFIFATLSTLLWWLLLRNLGGLVLSGLPESKFLLATPDAAWFLPAIFLGIVTAALPMHLLYSRLLGERYAEYNHYTNLRTGFDGFRIFRWMAIILVPLCLLAALIGLDWYTRVLDDRLIDNSPLSIGETEHRYADIAEIRAVATFRAPNGNIVQKPYFQVVFNDGFTWSTRNILNSWNADENREMIEFISRQADKPITAYLLAPEQQ
ncbi:MAG: hypothetical protein QM775_13955 [Pirellulales bacterium]